MSPSLSKQIKKLVESLEGLKSSFDKKKHKTIEECTKKKHLENFDVVELIAWLSKNEVDLKKINKKHKRDFIELVWETLEEEYESESESDESSSDESSSDDSSDDE
jgi:hypothetical protein